MDSGKTADKALDATGTRAEVDRILAAPLDELRRCSGAPVRPSPQVADWILPAQGRRHLQVFGLPPARNDDLLGIVGSLQESETPEPGRDGRPVYRIGSYGSARIAAVEGTGEVLLIPADSQVHPDLAHLHPAGLLPTTANSTMVGFVECAWRWHWILPLLAAEQVRAGDAETAALAEGRIDEEVQDPYDGYQSLCRHVLHRFQSMDAWIQDEGGFWSDVIIDVW
ncbi:SUKH-4 family immunity protein [Streptomyces sp. NPDC051740]|uniref:SUKH-4 family immunity protein n=1 Tax=Streptomyces sp. NPDC051740 TaxID=3365673 RepID=UPI0037885FFB